MRSHSYPSDAEYYLARGSVILKIDNPEWSDGHGNFLVAIPTHCKHLTIGDDLKLACDIHNKDEECETCKLYPSELPNDFYKALATLNSCGYFFIEFEPDLMQPLAC